MFLLTEPVPGFGSLTNYVTARFDMWRAQPSDNWALLPCAGLDRLEPDMM